MNIGREKSFAGVNLFGKAYRLRYQFVILLNVLHFSCPVLADGVMCTNPYPISGDQTGRISSIEHIGDKVLIVAEKGLFSLNLQGVSSTKLVSNSEQTGHITSVHKLKVFEGQEESVFIRGEKGLFRLTANDTADLVGGGKREDTGAEFRSRRAFLSGARRVFSGLLPMAS